MEYKHKNALQHFKFLNCEGVNYLNILAPSVAESIPSAHGYLWPHQWPSLALECDPRTSQ